MINVVVSVKVFLYAVFHLFYPLFSWIFQNENVLFLILKPKPLFYAGLNLCAGYSVFNRIFRSEKVFACVAV